MTQTNSSNFSDFIWNANFDYEHVIPWTMMMMMMMMTMMVRMMMMMTTTTTVTTTVIITMMMMTMMRMLTIVMVMTIKGDDGAGSEIAPSWAPMRLKI